MEVVGPSEDEAARPGPSVFVVSEEFSPEPSGLPLELCFKSLVGEAPKSRCWGAHDVVEGRLVLFGGYSGTSATYFNDVWCFDATQLVWKKVFCTGPCPPPLYAHTMNTVERENGSPPSLVVCCGGTGRVYNSAVHVLDLDFSSGSGVARGHWRGEAAFEQLPSKRGAHASAVVGGCVYVMGGDSGQGVYFRDVLRIDPVSQVCEKLRVKGTKPAKRGWHSMVAYKTNLIVFGGTDGSSTYFDVHVFDTVTRTWSKPDVTGELPEARFSHSSVVIGNEMLVFGGTNRGKVLNSACVLNLERFSWIYPRLSGDVPSPRYGHCMSLVKDKIFLYGGYAASGAHASNQMFYLPLANSEQKREVQTLRPVILHDLVRDLRSMLNGNAAADFSDVTFMVENRPIAAHRAVLAARCDYFRHMFGSGMRESAASAVIPITEMKYDVFKSVLEYLYSGCPTLNTSNAVDVLMAADLFRIDSLKDLASRVLIRLVSIHNLQRMYALADRYNAAKLKSSLIKYARRNATLLQSMPDLPQIVIVSNEDDSDD